MIPSLFFLTLKEQEEQVAPGTVTNQIISALRGGMYNKGVTLKYVFDHSATKTKHIIKKEEENLENIPF